MMLFVMTHFYDAKTLVIYSVLPQVLVGTIGLMRSPRTVELRFLGGMLGFAALGSAAGLALFYFLPLDIFQKLLAATIIVFGAYLVLAPARVRLTAFGRRALDALAGISQALFGISGPIAMTRLLGSFDDKLVIRNYALAFFLSLNVIRATGYVVNGTVTPDIAQLMIVSGPFLAVALWYTNHLHLHVNERWFKRVVAWVILLGGISLLFSGGTQTPTPAVFGQAPWPP
jgi:uncharacterized membrane protein YfcA